jgi:hypothetical protein
MNRIVRNHTARRVARALATAGALGAFWVAAGAPWTVW